ncbi:MAG TPA: hypothetical protein VF815_06555 [Myxococcaceae bacterium]|jgi:hypothetical protein
MKASKLIDFLISLGTDPEALRRYQQTPEAAMKAAGLSAEEQALLARGNQHQLRAAILAADTGALHASGPKPPNRPGPPPPGYMYMDTPAPPPSPGPGYMHPPAQPPEPPPPPPAITPDEPPPSK